MSLPNIEQKQVEKAVEAVQAKAMEDEAFRQRCFDEPLEAAREVSDISIPDDFTLKFVEPSEMEKAKNLGVNMIVPLPESGEEERELDQNELEQATGGLGFGRFVVYGEDDGDAKHTL